MSRSRKKHPFNSTTCIGSRAGMMKGWKKEMTRKLRREPIGVDTVDLNPKKYGSHWQAPNDGKSYWDNPKGYRK